MDISMSFVDAAVTPQRKNGQIKIYQKNLDRLSKNNNAAE